MRKSTLAVIVVVVIVVVAIVVALTRNSTTNNPNTNNSPSSTNNSSQNSNNNQAAASGTINIRNMMFTPPQISIQKGGTVTWTNNDSMTHTVVDDLSNVGGPHSGNIAPGSSYSFTFNKTGSFQYHCSIHPSMRGTIVVK